MVKVGDARVAPVHIADEQYKEFRDSLPSFAPFARACGVHPAPEQLALPSKMEPLDKCMHPCSPTLEQPTAADAHFLCEAVCLRGVGAPHSRFLEWQNERLLFEAAWWWFQLLLLAEQPSSVQEVPWLLRVETKEPR